MTAGQSIQSRRHDEDQQPALKLSVTMKMTATVVVVSETAGLLGFSHQPSLSLQRRSGTEKTGHITTRYNQGLQNSISEP